ncbi:glycosyltransferase [Cohnella sp. JJ-181]|uniref:glycosyltransferase n=1 Tax=Cohnella rhizoplanae TaxID=2974897 RepID=UPI0022FF759A|nr:glycosyltransferase [Cohnella sp. JJ-181]CAI6036776.1 D-inositol-3-phosphate glycosyltransferase [Cohnella sp. JJ-181]
MSAARIVIVNHVAMLGGAERVLMNWLEQVDRARFLPELVLLEGGPMEAQVKALGFDVHVVPSGRIRQPVRFARTVGAIRRVIRGAGARLVVSWSPKPHFYGGTAAWMERIPALWWQHGVPSGGLFDKSVSLLPAQAVVCPSTIVSEAQRKVRASRPTFVQPPGIPVADYEMNAGTRRAIRESLGIGDRTTVFAFIGRLQRWKRTDMVIRAFRQALRGQDARLLIVGGALFGVDADFEEELKRLVQDAGLAERVHFVGHQSRIEPYLWASDVVISSSASEPFGMVVVEAMAAGRIVLAVDAGGPAEIVRSGRDGILYDGSEEDLARWMGRISADPQSFEALGDAALARARGTYAARAMSDRFEGFLEGMLTS